MNTEPVEQRDADFSEGRKYRYALRIRWAEGKLVQFIGLNPSTADEIEDDPTIRRCKGFAKSFGAGGMVMTNLFAWRSTDPAALLTVPNPIGEDGKFFSQAGNEFTNRNDLYLYVTALECPTRIACWGKDGKILYRAAKVKQWMTGLCCLKINGDGSPQHPLYLKKILTPIPFR